MVKKYVIITSIQDLTESVLKYAEMKDWQVVIVGDKKSPKLKRQPHPNITFLSIEEQEDLDFASYSCCPFNHYSRKNLGYLYAISQGAEIIADADDDNMPYSDWETSSNFEISDLDIISGSECANVYRYFTDEFVWPRGYPLSTILNGHKLSITKIQNPKIAIIQGLVDGDPDVDAIYRLTVGKPVTWRKCNPIVLNKGTFCPINSQNTFWAREAFTYMYLPTTVTFRFTDILRGYIAQAGIWSIGAMAAFTSPSVFQSRNLHDFKLDFIDEIPCYMQVESLIKLLTDADLTGDSVKDLTEIYKVLHSKGIVSKEEIICVTNWIEDLNKLELL